MCRTTASIAATISAEEERLPMLISQAPGSFVPLQSLYGPLKPIHLGIGRTLVHSGGGWGVFRRHKRMSCLQPWTRSGLWTKDSVPRSGKKRRDEGRLWPKHWKCFDFFLSSDFGGRRLPQQLVFEKKIAVTQKKVVVCCEYCFCVLMVGLSDFG